MVIPRDGKDAAVPGRTGGIGVLEDIATAIDPGPLAVPECKDAVVARAAEKIQLLRAPDRCSSKILINAGLEDNVMAVEVRLCCPQALVETTQR